MSAFEAFDIIRPQALYKRIAFLNDIIFSKFLSLSRCLSIGDGETGPMMSLGESPPEFTMLFSLTMGEKSPDEELFE